MSAVERQNAVSSNSVGVSIGFHQASVPSGAEKSE
jgi:hypothetical protein